MNSTARVLQDNYYSAIVPQESTANSNLGCGTIITSGTIAGIRDFWLRYFYYQRYFSLRLESWGRLIPGGSLIPY